MIREDMFVGLLGLFLIITISCQQQMREEELVAKAKEIHERVLTLDTHHDIAFNFTTEEVDLPKMARGGLDVGFFIVYVGQTKRTPENYEQAKKDAMTKFDAIHRMTKEMYLNRIELAYSADDIERIASQDKLAACIRIENGFVIGKDLSLLEKYYNLGARYITLAHNGHNDIGDSANPRESLGDEESEHDGISEFGKQVIAEMNRLGIMVDVSHLSKKSMLDAVKLSKAPVIASHSSCRALCDVSRNMDDKQLLALKENGGVMQTVAAGSLVKKNPPEKNQAIENLRAELNMTSNRQNLSDETWAEYRRRRTAINARWPVTLADFVDHIDHAVKLIGIAHVGISSHFDGGGGVMGWNDASETPNVTLELVRRGYSEEEIARLWGGNALRVLRQVEQIAAENKTMSSR